MPCDSWFRVARGHGALARPLLHVGKGGKIALGSILVVMGALVLSGLDKQVETFLVNSSPHWLTDLTTRF
jgi:hypothetical protein